MSSRRPSSCARPHALSLFTFIGLSVLAGACGAPSHPAAAGKVDPSDELYDPDHLPRFDLTVPPESLAALAGQCRLRDRPYVPAAFRYGAETFGTIGVRLKGEASCRDIAQKPALKIQFDEYVPGQRFRGLKNLTLNNAFQDRSFIAERLSYLVFRRAGLPASRANNALLFINGEFYGVYVNIEAVDKTFLRRWFDDDEGNIYEENRVDFLPGNEARFDLETNEKTNDRSDLARFIATLQAARPESYLDDLAPVLDVPQFLRFTAAEGIVNQWDMYTYTIFILNNFRIYGHPRTGRFTFIPWGMDHTLKRARKGNQEHVPLFTQAQPGGVIMRRCFMYPSCKERYRQVIPEISQVFESLDLGTLARRYRDQIRLHVEQDTRKGFGIQEFDATVQHLLDIVAAKPAWVRAQLMLP